MKLMQRVQTLIGKHQRCPTGIVGWMIGEQMVRQHEAETGWSIEQLAIQPTDHILEIGFGAGKAIERMALEASRGSIAGVDPSHTMMRVANRRNAQARRAGHLDLRHGDAMALPFADLQFEKVLSIHTFYFWSDPAHGIAEIFRVLKPGGIMVVKLSTGKADAVITGLERYQTLLEEQIIPAMKQIGFSQATLKHGPYSRQYNSVAIVGVK